MDKKLEHADFLLYCYTQLHLVFSEKLASSHVQGEGIWKASEAPANKRRRPKSSSLSLKTKSVTDDRNEYAAARNEGGAPAGNAVNGAAAANGQDVRDAVEVDNVPAAQQVLEGTSSSTELEENEDNFSALGWESRGIKGRTDCVGRKSNG